MPKFKIIVNIIAVITAEPTTSFGVARLCFDKYFNFFFVFFLFFISFAHFIYLKSKRRKVKREIYVNKPSSFTSDFLLGHGPKKKPPSKAVAYEHRFSRISTALAI